MLVQLARRIERSPLTEITNDRRCRDTKILLLLSHVSIGSDAVHFAGVKVNFDQLFDRIVDDNLEVLQRVLVGLRFLLLQYHIDDRIFVQVPENRCDVDFVLVLIMTDERELLNLLCDVMIAEVAQN